MKKDTQASRDALAEEQRQSYETASAEWYWLTREQQRQPTIQTVELRFGPIFQEQLTNAIKSAK